jgi:ribosomal peptide maturation radical SAM protein 1
MEAVGPAPGVRQPEVLLVSMPWASAEEPSLGLGILAAQLRQHGVRCAVRHLNLLLLKHLKASSYDATGRLFGLNDFLFTGELQPEVSEDQSRALIDFMTNTYGRIDTRYKAQLDPAAYVNYAMKVRDEIVPQFLLDCLAVVSESDPTMVGFTCMYDQTFASLALARLIKRNFPDKLIVFGGYAMRTPVGEQIMRSFPFVDAVAPGEAEHTIVPLAAASVNQEHLRRIPRVLYRDISGKVIQADAASPPVDLDKSPTPDYSDWFGDTDRLEKEAQVRISTMSLPLETSRGCWWGQVSHCVFCGIDDETMRYRYKSSVRVKEMMQEIRGKYGISDIRFSDYILSREFYKTLLPELAHETEKYKLRTEIKSNLRWQDVQVMAEAGFAFLQPGIESFSTPVLRKMGKGVTGIQNVLTIRLLMEHAIFVGYNILYGFPDDEPAEYEELIARIPLLYHFIPPQTYMAAMTTRYAPLQTDPARFGITGKLVAHRNYDVVLSRKFREEIGFELENYCYVFETPYEASPELQRLYGILIFQVHHWITQVRGRDVRLSWERTEDGIVFDDSRFAPEMTRTSFGRDHADVYKSVTNVARTEADLAQRFAGRSNREHIARIIADLEAARLLYREGDRLLGLALPAECYRRRSEPHETTAAAPAHV